MYRKAQVMGDVESAEKILGESDPKAVQKLGRAVSPWDQGMWDANVVAVAYEAIWQKFSQNPDLANRLLNTGYAELLEASPYDSIWGIGMSEADVRAGIKWSGQNILGKALMNVRHELRE